MLKIRIIGTLNIVDSGYSQEGGIYVGDRNLQQVIKEEFKIKLIDDFEFVEIVNRGKLYKITIQEI